MFSLTVSPTEAITLADGLDATRGLPRSGVHVGLGPHCILETAWDGTGDPPVGWTSFRGGVHATGLRIYDDSVALVDVTDLSSIDAGYTDAVGDGVADDYQALLDASTCAAAHPGCLVLFPAGTYLIDQYRIGAGNAQELPPNGVTSIVWSGLDGVAIVGIDATISVKGDFLRSADVGVRSVVNAVIPFEMQFCCNFSIGGLTLLGNVDQMTADEGVTEGYNHGIATSSCTDYLLHDLTIAGFATDGMMLGSGYGGGGAPYTADRRVVARNVISQNNGRNALSVIQLRDGLFEDCNFTASGRDIGSYPGHSPRAGVDVEPNYSGTAVDVNTGGLLFSACVFADSIGSQFVAVRARVEGITLRECTIEGGDTTYGYTAILAVKDGLIEDCEINTGATAGGVYLSWEDCAGCATTLRRTNIATLGWGLAMTHPEVHVVVDDCILVGAGSASLHLPYCLSTNVEFKNNNVFVPKEAYSGTTYCVASLVQGVALSSGNHFTTDLVPGEGGAPAGAFFCASYDAALVVEDWFGANFTPGYGTPTWDPETPYSQGTP